VFDRIQISNPGLSGTGRGIAAANGAKGAATIRNVTVTKSKSAGWKDDAPGFKLVRESGNSGIDEEKSGS